MKNALILSLGLAFAGTVASAHAHLIAEVPANNAVVTVAPTALQLSFSEGVALKFTGVKIIGPNKAVVATSAASLDPKDDTKLTVPVSGVLTAGVYTVDWHALSTDGHKTHGRYTFTVK
jgi:copper resistance protein C